MQPSVANAVPSAVSTAPNRFLEVRDFHKLIIIFLPMDDGCCGVT
jgi:hypothetical protein